jgi:hypothetical protein
MKKHLVLLFLLFSIVSISQSSFCDGWREGYKEGSCYGKVGCVPPVPPVCPVPQVGQDTYRGGYNAGFIEGRKNNTENSNAGGAYGQLRPLENTNIGSVVEENLRYNQQVKNQRKQSNKQRFPYFIEAKNKAINAFEEGEYNECISQYIRTRDMGFKDADFEFVTGMSYKYYWEINKGNSLEQRFYKIARKHLRLARRYGHPEAKEMLVNLRKEKKGG